MAANPTVQASPRPPRRELRTLATLAFAESRSVVAASDGGQGRHLAFLTSDSFALDLSDPAQRQFGQYELLELLGEGGMGVVYRARQLGLEREVALKLLSAGPWASREFVERFRHEAQNAARMQHPNIVAIHEIGAHEDLHYFSMRLVRGQSLAAHLRECGGKLSPREAASLLRTVAEAVDYAHRLGVLHLDLKPGNILLDEHGQPHVADFGLARRLDATLAAEAEEISGTPCYMAPEQAALKDRHLSPATDIWGLGAVLYELLTGTPPFLDKTPQATLALVREAAVPSARRANAAIPHDLDAIVARCLRKHAGERYASARELADDLGQFLDGRAVAARPLNAFQRSWRWARREPYLAFASGAAMFVLLVGLVATSQQWRRAESNARAAQDNAHNAERSALTASERLWEGRRDTALRLMRDGKAFDALPLLVDNIEEQARAGRDEPGSVERREIGMTLAQSPVLIDRMLVPGAALLTAGLSEDGSLLALGFGDMSVRWYDTATLTERGRVDMGDLPTSDGEERTPRLLRFIDNHRLNVTLDWDDFLPTPSENDSWLVDLDAQEVLATPGQDPAFSRISYSPDGRYALIADRQGTRQLWQTTPWRPLSAPLTARRQATGEPWLLGPDAAFVLIHGSRSTPDSLLDPRTGKARPLHMPADASITATATSRDGKTLALGDSRGRVFVVDTAQATARELSTPFGREVTALAFSEDDAWLGVARWDGAAFAFDVASGTPLSAGQMQHDYTLRQVDISHRERLLAVSGPGPDGPRENSVWRLAMQGSNGEPSHHLLASTGSGSPSSHHGSAMALGPGLMVTTSLRGEVMLWRLPQAALRTEKSNFLPQGTMQYDGARVPDVAWRRLRISNVHGGGATPWVELPHPVSWTELADEGRLLAAVVGRHLHVFDARTLQPRYAPVELPGTPQHQFLAADGRLVLGFGGNGPLGFEERLIAWNLRDGRRQPGEAVMKAPLRRVDISADGRRLLAVGPADSSTELFDIDTWQRRGRYPHDPERPVVWASFTAKADDILLVTRPYEEPAAASSDLVRWHPAGGTGEHTNLPGVWVVGVREVNGKPYVTGREQMLLDPGGPDPRTAQRPVREETAATTALSPDGRVLAQVYGHDVQLYDAATLAEIGPPLASGTRHWNSIQYLAFSPDGSELLAHSGFAETLIWPVPSDTRALSVLREDARRLASAPDGGGVLAASSQDERDALRRRDPGPWPTPEERPVPQGVRNLGAAGIVPERDPGTSPLLLDLTAAYSLSYGVDQDIRAHFVQAADTSPLGVVRFDGVDYDVRGLTELSNLSGGFDRPRTPEIRTPATPIAAFHLLLYAPLKVPEEAEREYATLVVNYRDGSRARLPLRVQRELPGYTDQDRVVPFGFVDMNVLFLLGQWRARTMSNPRLANPHPERPVASVVLECAPEGWSYPVLYAITAEANGDTPPAPVPSPVIALPVSGTKGKANEPPRARAGTATRGRP